MNEVLNDLKHLFKFLLRSRRAWNLRNFYRAGGDKLRYNYNLNKNSVVFDVGGYKGEFAENIIKRFGCRVFVFEPVLEYYKNIAKRFKDDTRVKVFNYGLSDKTLQDEIVVAGDSSSRFIEGKSIPARFVDFKEAFKEIGVSRIDLLKINIEGGEYALLERIIRTGLIKKINNIQVQFHEFFVDSRELRSQIQRELEKTHKLDWNYDFVWESWSKKPAKNK